jgi:glucose-6-phosphate isomerase
MLKLNSTHADVVTDDMLKDVQPYTQRLQQIRQRAAYDEPESSINLAGDQALYKQVQTLIAQKVTPALKYSIVVGIGGSNLGTKAIYDALLGYGDVLAPDRTPKMLFAETTDAELLAQLVRLLGTLTTPEEVIVTLISKSGGTTETLANFEIIVHALHEKFGAVNDRVIAITDEGSKLWQAADAKGIAHIAIPAVVGGRYSVLSAVGLVPLCSIGVDCEALRRGANDLLDQCFGGDNIAAQSAATLALQGKQGCHINDNFFFHPELESLGKWYRQLMGESIGKERSLDGTVVHAGMTPTVSLGSTDLHSVGQLYLGGPRDKITTFIYTAQSGAICVPEERYFAELVPMITGTPASDIMAAILEGTKVAYQKAALPFMEVLLETIDAYVLGGFLQFKMLEMMYLGQLLNVNSFDQPNVEAYKVETKRLLEVGSQRTDAGSNAQ